MQRWAENSVEGHISTIKALIPEALIIHMIRDGRDVATSLHNSRYVRTLPWKSHISLPGGWRLLGMGRPAHLQGRPPAPERLYRGSLRGSDGNPQQTLDRVGAFIDHELDYERIRHIGYGSISKPNTLFSAELKGKFSSHGPLEEEILGNQSCAVSRP